MRRVLKVDSDNASLIYNGKIFQSLDHRQQRLYPLWASAWSLVSLIWGTEPVKKKKTAERGKAGKDHVRLKNKRIFKRTLKCTGSPWSDAKIGVIWSLLCPPIKKRAAAFWTRWRRKRVGWLRETKRVQVIQPRCDKGVDYFLKRCRW